MLVMLLDCPPGGMGELGGDWLGDVGHCSILGSAGRVKNVGVEPNLDGEQGG